jgi:hypothetical protein
MSTAIRADIYKTIEANNHYIQYIAFHGNECGKPGKSQRLLRNCSRQRIRLISYLPESLFVYLLFFQRQKPIHCRSEYTQ